MGSRRSLVVALFLSPSWWIRLVLSGPSAITWITRAAVLAGRRFSVHPSQAIPLAFQRLSSTLTRALVNIVRVNADDFPPLLLLSCDCGVSVFSLSHDFWVLV